MAKYRFEAQVQWNLGKKSERGRDFPIDFFSPYQAWVGDKPTRSDYCTNLSELSHLELLVLKNQVFTIVAPELIALYDLQVRLATLKMEMIFLSTYDGERHISTISCYRPRQTQHLRSPKGKMTMKMRFNAPGAPSAP